jgi:hypothetical protein
MLHVAENLRKMEIRDILPRGGVALRVKESKCVILMSCHKINYRQNITSLKCEENGRASNYQ